MTDEVRRKPPPRRASSDDDVVYIPPAPDTERSAPRKDLFHEELALQRAELTEIREVVQGEHAPRIDKVEKTLGQKVAKGGGIVGAVLVAAPLLADAWPKYRWLFEALTGGE